MKKVILKNGIKIKVSNKEATLLSDALMAEKDLKYKYVRSYIADDFLKTFKLDEIVAII